MPSASNSCAREKLAERQLRLGERQRADLRIAEHVGDDVADDRGLPRLLLADRGVARDHMRHLVRQHRGELGLVVGERDQAARDVELAVRQREGVDRRRIEDRHLDISGPAARTPPPGGRRSSRSSPAGAHCRRRRHRRPGCARARAAPPARAGRRGGFRHRQRNEAVGRRAGAAGEQNRECSRDAELTPHLDCRLSPHDPPTLT